MSVFPPPLPRTARRELLVSVGVLAPVLVCGALPAARIAVDSPSARVALETLRLCVVGGAAGIMALPYAQRGPIARNAFVAALVVIATASLLLGVLPPVIAELTGGPRSRRNGSGRG